MFSRLLPAVIIALIACGCESGSGGQQKQLQQATADYESRNYAKAQTRANEVLCNAEGVARDEAAYLAGLSEYQLGQLKEADEHLSIASSSCDPKVAAKGKAMLGLLRMKQQRPREAAPLFAAAADAMPGEDGRMAAYQAAAAYRQAGDNAAAQRWASRAGSIPSAGSSGSTSASWKPASSPQTLSSRFSLQVGAFRDQTRAQSAASQATNVADRHSLGPVRVIPTTDDRGSRLYIVQFGSFESRAAAAGVRQRLGKLEYIVAPVAREG